jgi:hypothetical protein
MQYYNARVGSTAYNSGGASYKISEFLQHPLYNADILDYDFAILSLQPGVEIALGANVAIIPLASASNPADGSLTTVSGWGVEQVRRSTLYRKHLV